MGGKRRVNVGGTTEPRFAAILDQFRANFESGWEKEGSAFAVYYKNELVVDIWGGYADSGANRLWKEDTTTAVFSSTKAVSALVAAMLVDRGHLKYEALVTDYWPDFGKNGKENVTVRQLLTHQAGLVEIKEPITKEMAQTNGDWEGMGRVFENQTPNWDISTGKTGYHILTFGWLVDQLCRRTDPKKRSLGTFIKEEIATPHSLDFQLGLDKSDFHRVARGNPPGLKDLVYATSEAKTIALKTMLPFYKRKIDISNPKWFMNQTFFALNDPDILALEIGSATGVGTARGLAGIFNQYIQGSLVEKEGATWKTLLKSVTNTTPNTQVDLVIPMAVPFGHGFIYSENPKGETTVGHAGYGGQNVKFDLAQDLSFAYITNGLTVDVGDNARNFSSLQKALYDIILQ